MVNSEVSSCSIFRNSEPKAFTDTEVGGGAGGIKAFVTDRKWPMTPFPVIM